MITEQKASTRSGYFMVFALFLSQLLTVALVIVAPVLLKLIGALLGIAVFICWFGLFIVAPNQGKILQLFGKYVGTEHTTGLRWANPFYYPKREISLRIRNFESSKLKVNDASGNRIEIAAVIVWKVVDSAEAFFEVDDYESFVTIQSESALRNLANSYPYEAHKEGEITLRSDPLEIAAKLQVEVQERLQKAGVAVIEARISHLAYAQEMAQAMLRKQQAGAVLAARQLIVRGAVEIVTEALTTLTRDHNFELDDERRASMVSNLLVVICSEQHTQPVINAGSLY
ncbi:MAG: SPFH domain-containing protein [Gammaproteobacteria bacterium]|nr:SPFH domain-containing protein [Gammaproteobacteria bacterium]